MAFSQSQKFLIIFLGLTVISGGAVLGYRISQEYPTSVPQEIEKPIQIEKPLPQRPVVVTEKAPIRKLDKKEKEKLQAALKININTASSEELQKLYRVGPKTAAKIIAGRPYGKIEDITNVHGIGEKTFEKLKDSITVSGKGLEKYKPPAERAKAPEKEKKMVIVKIDTDGDGIPDTWITRPQ